MCSPTRHNICTGLYPVKSGAWPNHTRVYPVKSIVQHLSPLGYRVTKQVRPMLVLEVMAFEKFEEKPDMGYIDQLFGETVKGGKPFVYLPAQMNPIALGIRVMLRLSPGKIKLPLIVDTTVMQRDLF